MPLGQRALSLLVLIVVTAAGAEARAQRIMAVSEVRPGMRGYGLTVLRGTEPERFDVEVIDVLHQFLTRQDLILIRMSHPLLDRSGTVGGMSGSPIFIEDRLIGALAYGWYYAMDPIAGVTPIETMREELRRPLRGPLPGAGPLPVRRARALAAPPAGASPLAAALGPASSFWERFRESEGPVPAMTPLLLGGYSARVRAMLGEALDDYGMVPVEAGGAGGPAPLPRAGARPFAPGAAIGVQLVRGDLSATAIGTVTDVHGDQVLGFGHPMFNFGERHWPVVTARILTVLASLRRSFKLGEPVAEAGVLTQDRQPCIVADTTGTAAMTPVVVRMDDRTTGRRDTFELEVVRDRSLLPSLGMSAVAAVLDRFASDRDDLTITMRGALAVRGHGPLVLEDHAFTELGTGDGSTLLRMAPLAALSEVVRNDFEPAEVERLDLDVALDFRREEAEIIGAYVTAVEPEAGSRIAVNVVLRPFAGPEEVRVVPIQVPRTAGGQEIQIEVTGGDGARPPTPSPQSLAELLDNLRRTFPATSVVVTLTRPSRAVSVRGHVAEDLPPSALDALRPVALDAGEDERRTLLQVEAPAGRVVTGRARIWVRVAEPDA